MNKGMKTFLGIWKNEDLGNKEETRAMIAGLTASRHLFRVLILQRDKLGLTTFNLQCHQNYRHPQKRWAALGSP